MTLRFLDGMVFAQRQGIQMAAISVTTFTLQMHILLLEYPIILMVGGFRPVTLVAVVDLLVVTSPVPLHQAQHQHQHLQ